MKKREYPEWFVDGAFACGCGVGVYDGYTSTLHLHPLRDAVIQTAFMLGIFAGIRWIRARVEARRV